MKYLTWFILAFSVFFSYMFVNKFMGVFCFLVFFLKVLADLGIFASVNYAENDFEKCYMWYKDYEGNYSNINKVFREIMKKFKLDKKKYLPFGIYHDDPSKCDPNKCKAVVGILRYDKNKSDKDKSLNEYNDFKGKDVKPFKSLVSVFPFFNMISLIIAVMRYYPRLNAKISSKEFDDAYGASIKGIPGIIEVYPEDTIEFHFPLKNFEDLPTHSKYVQKQD